jgi:hypothetical protein
MQRIVDKGIGINPSNVAITDYCQVQHPQAEDSNFICSSGLQTAPIHQFFTDNCIGKTNCEFSLDKVVSRLSSSPRFASCSNPNALLFIQHTCEQDLQDQSIKYRDICIITVIIMTVGFIYIMMIRS